MQPHRLTLRCILEICIALIAMGFFNQNYYPDEPGFFGWSVSPLWLVILVFSLRYGFATGLTGGILCSGYYLGFAYLAKDGGYFILDRHLFAEPDFYLLPSSFIAVAGIIGWTVSNLETTAATISSEKENLARLEKPLHDEIDTLKNINLALEKKVVTQMSTMVTMYEGARLLEHQDSEAIIRAIPAFFSKIIGAEESAIYIHHEGRWVLSEVYGSKKNSASELNLNEGAEKEMARLAVEKNSIVSIRDFIQNQRIDEYKGKIIVAAPIYCGDEKEPFALYCISKIALGSLNSSLINSLAFLTGWAGRSLAKARAIDDLKENAIIDSDYQVFSRSYFVRRCAEEFDRSKKYYLPLSFAQIKLVGLDGLKPEAQKNWLVSLVSLLRNSFREMDVVGIVSDEPVIFGVLVITCPADQAEEMADKLRMTFSKLGLGGDVQLDVKISHFQPKMSSFEDMSREKNK